MLEKLNSFLVVGATGAALILAQSALARQSPSPAQKEPTNSDMMKSDHMKSGNGQITMDAGNGRRHENDDGSL